MVSSRTLLFVCLMFNILVTLVSAQKSFLYEYCVNEKGNFTTNSTYQTNLKQVLSILPSTDGNFNGSGNGFYSVSYGQNSDEVYAIGLCQGDVEPHICRSCLNQSSQLLTQTCPNQKEAIGWFDECMLRYSHHSLIGLMETHPKFHSWSTQNSSFIDMDSFSQNVTTLLENLKNGAAAGGSLRKYAAGNASVLDQFQTLYAFAQCTPDLSQLDCNNCLDEAFGDISQYNQSVGGRVCTPSCNFRYEVYPFDGHDYDASPASRLQSTTLSPPATATDSKTRKGNKSNKSRTVIIAVVSSVAAVVLIISLGVYPRMKKKAIDSRVESTPPTPHSEEIQRNTSENNRESKRMLMWRYLLKQFVHTGQDISSNEEEDIVRVTRNDLRFDISTIRAATDNFSARNKIADNKYVCLYKGRLSDGQNIAVKSLHAEHLNRSFVNNEIVLYDAKVQHRNIVRLLGFCLKGDDHKRRFLVYEFLPTPLDRLIFGDPLVDGHTCLDWGRRYDIIRGIARGLLYLHEEYHSTIIHRDIKASNILLDENMNPKISGFDLAMFSNDVDETKDVTFAGTMGYMDPDLFTNGTVSTKSDVFSFGVLLLEIVTGQRCGRHWLEDISEDLPSYVRRNYMEHTILNVVDPKITDGLDHQIMRCLHIGLLCTEIRRDARPTMRSVVHMLDCYTLSLPDPNPVVNNIDELDGGSSLSSDHLMSPVIESIDHSGGGFVRTESETSITSVDIRLFMLS